MKNSENGALKASSVHPLEGRPPSRTLSQILFATVAMTTLGHLWLNAGLSPITWGMESVLSAASLAALALAARSATHRTARPAKANHARR
jgi:hypothetical protein